MIKTINRVHPELVKSCPSLAEGISFSISKEGKIQGNAPMDLIREFLDKHCPDRKFIRTGKFKDEFSKAVVDQTEEIEDKDHEHFCEIMGISYKKNVKKTKRVVIIPLIDLVAEQSTASVLPDLDAAVLVYIFMNDGLYSISPQMFRFAQEDHKMLSLANRLLHYPTCVFTTSTGPKSYEDRRPIYHLVDKVLVLQATDTPLNKIRKSDCNNAKSVSSDADVLPSTVYVAHEGTLRSTKLAQFKALQDDISTIVNCKVIKHLPTCITLEDGILYSSDVKRPVYTIIDNALVQNIKH